MTLRMAASGTTEPGRLVQQPENRLRNVLQSGLTAAGCGLLGLLLVVTSMALDGLLDESALESDTLTPTDVFYMFDILLGVSACGVLALTRRAGAWNFLVILYSGGAVTAFPAVVIALVRLGALRRWRIDAMAIGLFLLISIGYQLVYNEFVGTAPPAIEVIGFAIILTAAAALPAPLWGRARATRQALVESLRMQVALSESQRSALVCEQRAIAPRPRLNNARRSPATSTTASRITCRSSPCMPER